MPIIRLGSTGPEISSLQACLLAIGYDVGNVDGRFGPRTERATKTFQRDHNLTTDGIVGPVTHGAIERAVLGAGSRYPWLSAKWFQPANRVAPADFRWIVMHSAELPRKLGAARAVGSYFGIIQKKASTHYVVDNEETIQCVLEKDVAYGAGGANRYGIHIELCDYARSMSTEWLAGPMLGRAAKLVAEICGRWEIQVRHLGAADLLAGARGITDHKTANDAFKKGSHYDVGHQFPWVEFVKMVERA